MIDIQKLRDSSKTLENSLKIRNFTYELTPLRELDEEIRILKFQQEQKQQQRNVSSTKIAQGNLSIEEKQNIITLTKNLGNEIKAIDEKRKNLEEELSSNLMGLPNILDPEVSEGTDEDDNKIIKIWGKPQKYDFQPLSHYELAEKLQIMDFPRGVKIAQRRFTLLQKSGAKLERAIANFMLDIQTELHGYEEYMPPYLVNQTAMTGTGQLPKFEEDLFQTTDGLYLIPTAEVPLTNIHMNEILPETEFPKQMAALTPCFRREAGSYGKDTRGYIRQHQFHKVELVWLTLPEQSEDAHQKLVGHAESILELLELPYRRVLLCGGDIGFSAAKCYDIEVWLPNEGKYREISSCSNCSDFQARRANIKYRPKKGGKPNFIHTLNGSGLAVGRTLVAILENYQNKDGSITIPKKLIPYMKGLTKIQL